MGTSRRVTNKVVATIPNGAAKSNAISLYDTASMSLLLPAAWTAADLTFEASFDGGTTWGEVWDDANAEVLIAAATIAARVGDAIVGGAIIAKLLGLPMIRLVSGNTAAEVNQLADRAFTVVLKS